MDLDDRVAVVCPDADFCEGLRVALAKRLGRSFEIVDAATASATLPRGRDEREGSSPWLVVDTVDNIDGLERLVVVCAGLDHAISVDDDDATALETRSRLYRAMTRAQLCNLPGFLGQERRHLPRRPARRLRVARHDPV
jgi:hypothetical protein